MKDKKYLWAGFSDGKIAVYTIDDGFGGFGVKKRETPALFLTRREARKQFQDVRKVEIREI